MFGEPTEYHAESTAKRIAAYARVFVKLHRQKHTVTE